MTDTPRITCVCPTINRPIQLANVVQCFLDQTYENRELIILDDVQQYPDGLSGDKWYLESAPTRYRTLGEKRNRTVHLATGDYIAVWDDDDHYFPWHLEAGVAALASGADYTIPTLLLKEKGQGGKLLPQKNSYLFHGAWCFTKAAWQDVEGYPEMQSGQDQGLLQRWKKAGKRRADPIQFDGRPSYVYRWFTHGGTSHSHISAGGHSAEAREDRYQKQADQFEIPKLTEIKPAYQYDWMKLFEDYHGTT